MKLLNFFEESTGLIKRPVILVGVFDGLHLGHQKLLHLGHQLASTWQGEVVVTLFSPHPRQILMGQSPPLITSLPTRLALLERLGVDAVLLIHFNQEVAQLNAQDFVSRHLVSNWKMGGIVTGENFRFGHLGAGNVALLQEMAPAHRYEVLTAQLEHLADGTVICSSNIRKAVQQGNMLQAAQMLGRPFSLLGRVVHGERRGRALGFPTANLELFEKLVPAEGVYWGYNVFEKQTHPSLISIGRVPTFNDAGPLKIEVNIQNFAGDLYGQVLETYVIEKIRNQQKFPGKEALCMQMANDRDYLLQRWQVWQIESPH